jgi:aspartate kinase
MNGVSKILALEGVAFISFKKIPSDIGFLAELFKSVADAGICIDMISQTSPLSGSVSVSFTFMESDMIEVLRVAKELGEKWPAGTMSVKPIVASGNCKLTLSGEEMRTTPGVYARALAALAKAESELIQVTTSETEVSLLIPAHRLDSAQAALNEAFGLN